MGCKHIYHVGTISPEGKVTLDPPSNADGGVNEKPAGGLLPNAGGEAKGKRVRVVEYDMSNFLESRLEKYKELNPNHTKFEKVPTPFINEEPDPDPGRDADTAKSGLQCPWCKGCIDRDTFTEIKPGGANNILRKRWRKPPKSSLN